MSIDDPSVGGSAESILSPLNVEDLGVVSVVPNGSGPIETQRLRSILGIPGPEISDLSYFSGRQPLAQVLRSGLLLLTIRPNSTLEGLGLRKASLYPKRKLPRSMAARNQQNRLPTHLLTRYLYPADILDHPHLRERTSGIPATP